MRSWPTSRVSSSSRHETSSRAPAGRRDRWLAGDRARVRPRSHAARLRRRLQLSQPGGGRGQHRRARRRLGWRSRERARRPRGFRGRAGGGLRGASQGTRQLARQQCRHRRGVHARGADARRVGTVRGDQPDRAHLPGQRAEGGPGVAARRDPEREQRRRRRGLPARCCIRSHQGGSHRSDQNAGTRAGARRAVQCDRARPGGDRDVVGDRSRRAAAGDGARDAPETDRPT